MENENKQSGLKTLLSGPRRKAILITFIVVALGLLGWLSTDYLIPKQVHIVINTMDEGSVIDAEVQAHTVGSALEKLGIGVSDIDVILPYLSENLKDDTTITITKRLETTAIVAGKKTRFIMSPGTVEENLSFNKITYDDNDIIKPKLTRKIRSTSNVEVKDVVIKITKKTKKVDFGNKVILDPTVTSGVVVEDAGVTGKALYKITTTYVNGKKTDRKKKFKKWLVEPKDHVIRLGTSLTGQSGEVSIRRTFVSNTTAYYAGKKGRGAIGQLCHYGTVAVDPKVFPYGSTFWISGYGFGYANDCGGAIKGTKLDLYMRSTKECYRWGRRHVTAYLLG